MNILNLITPEVFKPFFLILVRVTTFLFLFPIFNSRVFPMLVKAFLSLMITMLLYNSLKVNVDVFPVNTIETIIMFFSEFVVGLAIGLSVLIFFAGVQFAGQVIGFQMGFSMINVVDPQSGTNISLIEQFAYWVAIIMFLMFNGHHLLIYGLTKSFDIINVGSIVFKKVLVRTFIDMSFQIFITGIKIGAPAIAALFLVNVGFGIMGKFAPQMNIMLVTFPISITVGLIFFLLSIQIIYMITKPYIAGYKEIIFTILSFFS